MLPQTWLPLTASLVAVIRSLTVGRGFSSMILAMGSEPHPVGVAVAVRPRVGVAGGGRRAGLAEDDHPGGAAVDAQRAARADVIVDDEDHLVRRVLARPLGAGRLHDRRRLHHMDALPRAD